jgi:pyruvate formate lyase activating enzyme
MQPEFLARMIGACHEKGVHTAVDTSGYVPWEEMERIVERADLFLYDLKTIDDEMHLKYTGVSNVPILKNLERLASVHDQVIVRIPLIPGVNDREEDRELFSRFIASLRNVKEVNLLPFHTAGSHKCARMGMTCRMPGSGTMNLQSAAEFADSIKQLGVTAVVGG